MKLASEIRESDLLDLLKRGSKDAFRYLYESYAPRIHRFAVGYLKSEHDAEELVQDVFLKVWNRRELLNASGNIKSYLYKIAVNCIYDFIRRRNVEQAFRDFAGKGEEEMNDTWGEIIFNDMMLQVTQLIDKMPEQRRKIFKLSKEEGLSNEEIVQKTGLSKRTVENHLYRATTFLKENIKRDSVLTVLFIYLFLN